MTKTQILESIFDYGYYFRAIIVTLYALFLFRLCSSRIIGQYSFFDLIIFIMLGAILGEAIIAKTHFLSSLLVCGLIALLHKFLAYLSFQNKKFGNWVRGNKIIFFKEGSWKKKSLVKCYISEGEILQSLRCVHGMNNLDLINEITMERNGQLSFTFKNPSSNAHEHMPENPV